ncbi:MAG: type II toxin-antitoxin system Phd/YefM family antitoxin [Bacillati bacterium ANGP1]|uniref:Type II toxin-antitoxin system Phd/YefM family antitoxin n=1 Tax=Candidatus Segetimicrobium genomatis TaxID=2569760 RepID=A0A537KDK3_9BACT|nr:MAG: type II toxin-antitoxin system Phd/YefM family antitoxin [Terrabacteria group bacterium ANGP1]
MKVYTYSEARQRLASLLEQSRREGQVQIRRRDGQLFVLRPASGAGSPLDVPAVTAHLRSGELAVLLQESRETGDRFWRSRWGRSMRRRAKRS